MFTVEEVARLMRVSPQTVRTWLREKKIRAVRIGRPWRIPESAIREMMGRQSTEEKAN